MKMFIAVFISILIGAFLGVVFMCLFQINGMKNSERKNNERKK